MTMLKNVRPHAIDVGGAMLPSGQAADLDEKAPAVAEAIDSGHLLALQSGAESETAKPAARKPKES